MNNINPSKWGPPSWDFLFYIALSYPDAPTHEDKNNMSNFFTILGKVLPCYTCRDNYSSHLAKFPLEEEQLANRYNLINWLINIRNEVNRENNKPLVTYESIMNRYVKGHHHNYLGDIHGFFVRNSKIILVVVLLIIIISLICFNKYK